MGKIINKILITEEGVSFLANCLCDKVLKIDFDAQYATCISCHRDNENLVDLVFKEYDLMIKGDIDFPEIKVSDEIKALCTNS